MSNDQSGSSKKRMRSPAYPATDLKEAIERAATIWKNDRNHETNLKSLSTHWGFNPASSSVLAKAAALKHFGLLDEVKGGSSGSVKLSDVAVKILANEDSESPERIAFIKTAALMPTIYSELWSKYNGQLPSDVTIKSYLVGERSFNPDVVNGLLKNFRDTITFAKLESGDTITEESQENDSQYAPMTQIATEPRPLSGPPPRKPQFYGGGAAPIVPALDELSLPLENGKVIRIPKMTEDDYDLFLETLQLWKRRIVIKPPVQEEQSEEKI